jgi:HPt (histidine-containing phosphotransfer) domain-containing protein
MVERLAQRGTAASAAPEPSRTGPPTDRPGPPADPAEPPFVLAAAMKQLGGREGLFRDMVMYLETQAREAFVEIRRAQAAADGDAQAQAAHALKGTLVYLGAAPAVAAAERAVRAARSGDLAAAGAACRDLEGEVARLQLALSPYRTAAGPHSGAGGA